MTDSLGGPPPHLARRIVTATVKEAAPELTYTPSGDAFRADDFALAGAYRPVLDERAEMVV